MKPKPFEEQLPFVNYLARIFSENNYFDKQLVKTMEECGELIQACSKFLLEKTEFNNMIHHDNLIAESTDVLLMIMQIRKYVGEERFDMLMDLKLQEIDRRSL